MRLFACDVRGGAVGDGLLGVGAQILVRIHRHLVYANLVMQVRTRSAACLSHVSDDLSALHMLARDNASRRKMPVEREQIVAVVKHHSAAVSGAHVLAGHVTVAGSAHRSSVWRFDIDARMKRAFSVDRIFTLTEARSYAAFNGPDRRRIGKLCPVAGKAG